MLADKVQSIEIPEQLLEFKDYIKEALEANTNYTIKVKASILF